MCYLSRNLFGGISFNYDGICTFQKRFSMEEQVCVFLLFYNPVQRWACADIHALYAISSF